jgi:hypothetical protein
MASNLSSLSQDRDGMAARRRLVAIIQSRVLNCAMFKRRGHDAVFVRKPQKSFAHLSIGTIVGETAASPRLFK